MSSRQLLDAKIEELSDEEVSEVLEYVEVMESVKQQHTSPDPFDEMIVALLSDAVINGPLDAGNKRRETRETERVFGPARKTIGLC